MMTGWTVRDGLAAAWIGLRRQIAWCWIWLRNPDYAAFLQQLYDGGERYATTVMPPDADRSAVPAWFRERVDRTVRSTALVCAIYPVPPGVNPNSRGWRRQADRICTWAGYPEVWEDDGAPAIAASIPLRHDRLLVSILYRIPTDDDGDDGTPEHRLTDARLSVA